MTKEKKRWSKSSGITGIPCFLKVRLASCQSSELCCEQLCCISVYFVHLLERCVLRQLLLHFMQFRITKGFIAMPYFQILGDTCISHPANPINTDELGLLMIPDCTTICSFYYSSKGQNGKRPWTINNTYWFRAIIPFSSPPFLLKQCRSWLSSYTECTWYKTGHRSSCSQGSYRNTTKNIIEIFGFVNLSSVLIYTCWCKGREKYKIAAN